MIPTVRSPARGVCHGRHRHFVRALTPVLLSLATGLGSACSSGVPSPKSELSSGQAVMDLGSLVFQLREENALLQTQTDSLRGAIAYQDTILRQIALTSGVSMRSYLPPAP